jgi:hypothetical protein
MKMPRKRFIVVVCGGSQVVGWWPVAREFSPSHIDAEDSRSRAPWQEGGKPAAALGAASGDRAHRAPVTGRQRAEDASTRFPVRSLRESESPCVSVCGFCVRDVSGLASGVGWPGKLLGHNILMWIKGGREPSFAFTGLRPWRQGPRFSRSSTFPHGMAHQTKSLLNL